ncbi:MAG: hypothetical protein ABS88_08670 [Sphingopyxis sp. SCN 67-31]|nr:MAG: hypothetical protein ABS88_08670 [Sphingopyxis sp. SCN 67-31]
MRLGSRLGRRRFLFGLLAFPVVRFGRFFRISSGLQGHDRDALLPVIRRFPYAEGEEHEQQAAGDQQGQAYGKRAPSGADAERFRVGSGRNRDQGKPFSVAAAFARDRGASGR